MSRSHRKDIFRAEQAGTAYIFGLIRGLFNNNFAKFLVPFDRELHADYFETKIRKNKPITQLIEGLKVTVTLLLTGPVLLLPLTLFLKDKPVSISP